MNGGKDCQGGEGEGPPAAQVPIGWKRRLDLNGVVYVSPSGSVLSCLEQVKAYLLTDGTCKCGLECPLILHKVFNFHPGAAVKQRTAEDAKADEDVTKLCNHKRKIIAVATLHKNAVPMVPSRSATPRAITNKPPEGSPVCVPSDHRSLFRTTVSAQRHCQVDLTLAQQQELYGGGYTRARLGSGSEHGHKSPFRGGPGTLLSPPCSPRTDPLGSPDPFARGNPGFHGTGSLGPLHGGRRTPLSPPGVLLHGPSSCAMAGRTNLPLSPTVTAKSPVMKKPPCGFPPGMDLPRTAFHHKPPPPPLPPPPCALQKPALSSEKDPLGILDPIPSKPVGQSAAASNPLPAPPSPFQPGPHSQVPTMNVVIPPAIVPLPSNLPLPTVKPGHVGHGGHPQRSPHPAAVSVSVSPSPVTSPSHVGGPGVARAEPSPRRSRSSSTSSDHGGFVMPAGPQKVPPRSPRSSVGSPRPSLPSSPSAKPDQVHQYKDAPGGGSSAFPPKGQPGLLGMPLNQILNRHNATSFPASSLLSAAAKAQLANQNKLTSGSGNAGNAGNSGCGGVPLDGHSTLTPTMFPPNPGGMPSGGEAQSGRAALRDKLMAQQRDPLRKRRQLSGPGNGPSNGPGSVFNMLKSHMGRPAEQLRAGGRAGGLPLNASMAQLLQSMSSHGSHPEGGATASACMNLNPGQLPFGESAQHPLHGRGEAHSVVHDSRHLFSGMGNQMQVPPRGNCRPLGPASLGNPPLGPHPHRLTHHQPESQDCRYILGQPNMASPLPNMASPLTNMASPLPNMTSPLPNMVSPLPNMTSPLRNMASPLSNMTSPLPNMTSPLPNVAPPLSNMASPLPNMTSPLQNMTSPLPNMTSPLPNMTSPLPSMTSPPPNMTAPLPNMVPPPPSVTSPLPNCNDGCYSQAILEPGAPLSCSVNTPGPGTLQPHSSSQMFQQLGQGLQKPPLPGGTSSSPMACLFPNLQVNLPENISDPNEQRSAQSRVALHPESTGMAPLQSQAFGLPAGSQGLEGLPGGGGQSVDAIYRAVVDAASKGAPVVITASQPGPTPALSAMSAFTASIGKPVSLPRPSSTTTLHGQRNHQLQPRPQTDQPRPQLQPHPQTDQPRPLLQPHPHLQPHPQAGQLHPQADQPFPLLQPHLQAGQTHPLLLPHPHLQPHPQAGQLHPQAGQPRPQLQPHPQAGQPRPHLQSHPQTDQPRPLLQPHPHLQPHPQAGQPHPPLQPHPQAGQPHPQLQPRLQVGPPRKNSEQGTCSPEGRDAHEFFRSPSRGTPRRQWDEAGPGVDGHTPWRGEEFLECSTQVQSSPRPERTHGLAHVGSPQEQKPPPPSLRSGDKAYLEEAFHFNACKRATLSFKEQTAEHCAHMNGGVPQGRGYGDILGPPRQDLMAEDQSPGSSTSLEGPLAKDYAHYNGHYNGCAPSPSDTKSLSSEEDLRHPDSPSSELLHYRPQSFSMGELVWGRLKGFPPWPVKLVNQDQVRNPALQNSQQDKVEPERLKTLTEDLEALNRATKRNRKGGKLNNHLEAAIHEAMSELDKMSGSVHQMLPRDRQIKPPKAKRRKISR